MIKTERDYQTIVTKREKSISGVWLYKIPDVNMQIKPFDIIGIKNGQGFAIELKICDLKKGLSYEQAYSMLRPNQIAALMDFQNKGGISLVRVYNIAEEREYQFAFKFLDSGNQVEL